ncbi:MAG: ABC transporter ATP-binding protein [Nitrospirae bacterium]|nr:ABC transporter ATP-binding protein [Nitrospirota bacterium]
MIELRGVEKVYRRGAEELHALRGINLDIGKGEFLSIVGPSGSGKSSLLHILGCLDLPTKGTMKFDDLNVEHMSETGLDEIRRRKIGFVFQQFYLMPGLSVFDNVALPKVFSKERIDTEKIAALLETVGLQNRMRHFPNQLSGGEMQRVAIARALANGPEIVLADEPTGNLDTENSERIFELLRSLNLRGYTIVMVTHNNDLASRADRTILLKDGLQIVARPVEKQGAGENL